ncbi:hypothetical protein K458DRAFT_421479 [Lentithecium fluviatile CBS 122367]|uniref:Uncharacterized protein n=1 Tax=Lentithecium fluviatile CBS 122367 TaxID=1168545 RepID=A0A6G1IQM4_9PLEO|nr:hypothetical protein K458DRAFT_421479 [Lentithecium fluviatile CBS 122367]
MPRCLTTLTTALSRIDARIESQLQDRTAEKRVLRDKRIREARWKELQKPRKPRDSPRSGECMGDKNDREKEVKLGKSREKDNGAKQKIAKQKPKEGKKEEEVEVKVQQVVRPMCSTLALGRVPSAVAYYREER